MEHDELLAHNRLRLCDEVLWRTLEYMTKSWFTMECDKTLGYNGIHQVLEHNGLRQNPGLQWSTINTFSNMECNLILGYASAFEAFQDAKTLQDQGSGKLFRNDPPRPRT